MSTLGDRIKQLRGTHSQRWLSDRLAIPQTTLSNYENNKSELNFAMIESITTIFSVNTDWLLFGRGPMHPESAPTHSSPQHQSPQIASQPCPSPCARCAKLEEKIEKLEDERRDLNTENRRLWRENSGLRERCATLEERQKQLAPDGAFSKQLISLSSEDVPRV